MKNSLFRKTLERLPKAEGKFVQKQMHIAYQIIETLKRKGWTQRQLAEKADMKEAFVSRVVSGGGNMTIQTLAKLEAALGEDILVAPKIHDEQQVQGYYEQLLSIPSEGTLLNEVSFSQVRLNKWVFVVKNNTIEDGTIRNEPYSVA